VNDFFGARANYLYVSNGEVWPSDKDGNVGDKPVSGQESDQHAGQETGKAIDESA
jgi:hypothetical protein